MRVQLGSVLFAAAIGVGITSGTAAAQNLDWATCGTSPPACSATQASCCTETAANLNIGAASGDKALIIPMDRCHQRIAGSTIFADPPATAPAWCADPSDADANGMFHAYGLVYRLMQVGVPVYWIVNPTKTATAVTAYGNLASQRFTDTDIDMWIMQSAVAAIPTAPAALTACASGCPVSYLNDALAVASTYSRNEFPLRGSVFLIPGTDTDGDGVTDRAEFNAFWASYGNGLTSSGKTCAPSNDCYDFTAVSMYEINAGAKVMWRDYITGTTHTGQVPVGIKLNYKPPRIARVKSGGNVSALFLQEANLNDDAATSCKQGVFVRASGSFPYEPVVCDLDEDDLNNNSLVTGNFGWAWFDGGASFASCSRALQLLRTYLTGVPGVTTPGNVMVNDSRLDEFEECTNHQLLGRYGAAYSGGTGALAFGNSVDEKDDEPFMIRYPTNLFAQYGDLPMAFAASSVGHWQSGIGFGYNTLFAGANNTLKRLLTRERRRVAGTNEVCGDTNNDGDVSDAGELPHMQNVYPWNNAAGCDRDPAVYGANGDFEDMATYGRFDNDPLNGIAFYLPGNNLTTAGVRGQLRLLLNSLIATPSGQYTPPASPSYEVARSSPIAPLINGVEYLVQGTYVVQELLGTAPVVNGDADIGNWYFPFRIGHMRARLATATGTVLFDAGCNSTLAGFACPAGSSGIPATRTIFTNSTGGDLRAVSGAKVAFNTSMAQGLKDLMKVGAPNLATNTIDTMINRVHQGYPNGSGGYISALGGIDRSTVAVIQESDIAPGGTARPMMIYFGAADGMLHAVCAETNAAFGCTDEGHELWAFLPRKMLPHIRTNTARIDGSPRVLDAYIDPDGAGTAYTTSWRTLLVFQTGMGDYTQAGREPAVYAIDITVPNNPLLLWEFTDSAPGTSSLGVGLSMSAGPTTIGGTTKYLAWAQTNNLGTSGPGTVVTAIDLASGAKYSQAAFIASPNPRTSGNDPMVRSGIPAGTVPLDLPSGASSKITDLMFTDIFGRVWVVNPDTLTSRNGTGPLFNIGADYYANGTKPAVFATGGAQYAVFATGGYTDPSNTTWPIACCSSANGSACDATQPNPPRVCSQYNNSTTIFPRQAALAVKIDTSVTSPRVQPSACDTSSVVDPVTSTNLPDCNTGILFRRDLGRDEKATSQALVVGTDIFFTTESDNVNRSGYGTTGAATGHMYQLASATGAQAAASTVVALGAGAPTASNNTTGARTVYAGGAGSFTTGSTATSGAGNQVTSRSSTGVSRRVWLRTE